MTSSAPIRLAVLCVAPVLLVVGVLHRAPAANRVASSADSIVQERTRAKEKALNVHYLEIVTGSVDDTCHALAKTHGVVFGDPVAELGNARTATLVGGGRIGVRAPMHDAEKPAVRPYVLVEDIEAALEAAKQAGAAIMVPSMEIPGQGTIALYTLGGIEHGLWQN